MASGGTQISLQGAPHAQRVKHPASLCYADAPKHHNAGPRNVATDLNINNALRNPQRAQNSLELPPPVAEPLSWWVLPGVGDR
eukprot:1887440-Alexandrium_andersonii.AAC.1